MEYISYEQLRNFKFEQKISRLWIFDIDETLYPYSKLTTGLREDKYIEFIVKLGVPRDISSDIMFECRQIYGNTIKGLISNFEFTDWHLQQLDNPSHNTYQHLKKDLELNSIISELDCYKMCLTNGSINHAKKVLEILELTNIISLSVCCDYKIKNFLCKPEKEVYEIVDNVFELDPENIYYYDDSKVNIEAAKMFKWNAFLVDKNVGVKNLLKEYVEKRELK